MPLGYRAGKFALKVLNLDQEKNHQMYAFSEMSREDSNGCFNDGVQAATGCTYGKGLFNMLNYGKLAIILFKPYKGAVRINVRNHFLEELAIRGVDFFEQRKRGIEPSDIPENITKKILEDWLLRLPDEEIFEAQLIEDFQYNPVIKSSVRKKCDKCGEYVYEVDLKVIDGKFLCKPDYYNISKANVKRDISN